MSIIAVYVSRKLRFYALRVTTFDWSSLSIDAKQLAADAKYIWERCSSIDRFLLVFASRFVLLRGFIQLPRCSISVELNDMSSMFANHPGLVWPSLPLFDFLIMIFDFFILEKRIRVKRYLTFLQPRWQRSPR